MSTATVKQGPTKVESLTSIFKGQAWLVKSGAEDEKLKALAASIMFETSTKFCRFEGKADRALKAVELMDLLPPIPTTDVFSAWATREYLLERIIEGLTVAADAKTRKVCAHFLLNFPVPEAPDRGKFSTVIRQLLIGVSGACSLELLSNATPTSNADVVLKAWQTIGISMSTERAIFASKCLAALGENDPKTDEVMLMLPLIQDHCVEFIGNISKVALAAGEIREQLQDVFRSSTSSLQLADKGQTVKFHCRIRRHVLNSIDAEKKNIEEGLLPNAVDIVGRWRRDNRQAPKFRVEIWAHLMPPSWNPGEHATAEDSFHRACE
jgi:hypothetical protein